MLAGVKPHLLVSDPPFGVNYDPSWRQRFSDRAGLVKVSTPTGHGTEKPVECMRRPIENCGGVRAPWEQT